jgi:hypothetical protein
MDPSSLAESVAGAGRGALVVAFFGAGWLAWGLGVANAFNGLVGPLFGLCELILFGCAIYMIRKGYRLKKQYPPIPESVRRATRKSFLLTVLWEFLAIAVIFIITWRLHRPDLGADWAAIVVGVHFLPLAKLFRAPQLGVIGILITLWSLISWALFRSNALVISVAIGTGMLLWIASISALLRARQMAASLRP